MVLADAIPICPTLLPSMEQITSMVTNSTPAGIEVDQGIGVLVDPAAVGTLLPPDQPLIAVVGNADHARLPTTSFGTVRKDFVRPVVIEVTIKRLISAPIIRPD